MTPRRGQAPEPGALALTKRQRKILEFVKEFGDRRGYAPTLGEIGRHFGLSSPATVHKHLRNLESKGALRRRWNQSRAIEVLPERGTTLAYEVALAGEIERGRPIAWLSADQAVPVPPGLVGARRTFVLRVRGRGFEEELVAEGDLLVVEDAEDLPRGALGVVVVRGGETLLATCERAGGRVRLASSRPGTDEPRVEPADEVSVRARVVGTLRKY